MRHFVRNCAILLFFATGIPYLRARLLQRRGPLMRVIAFHDIRADEADRFRKLINFFLLHFYVVSPLEFETRRFAHDRVNILLTFDDGFDSWRTIALPVLKEFGVGGVFFVNSGFLDACGDERRERVFCHEHLLISHKKPLSWEGLAEIMRALSVGARIGGHTIHHISPALIPSHQDEIEGDKELIEKYTGAPIGHFAYPFGEPGGVSSGAEAVVRAAGYRYAYTTEINFVDFKKPLDSTRSKGNFRIPRSCIDPSMPLWLVYLWIWGGYDLLKKLLNLFR